MLPASPDPVLSRRRVLALALLAPTLGSAAAGCGRSGPPEPDPLEDQLTAARRDSELAAAAAKAAAPGFAPGLSVVAAERARHATALVEELARAAGKPTPSAGETTSAAPSASASPGAKPGPPPPPPSVADVAKALRESADSAAKLAPTLSGYRAGLMGSIAAACATSAALGLVSTEKHR